jgi:hypothetical protein
MAGWPGVEAGVEAHGIAILLGRGVTTMVAANETTRPCQEFVDWLDHAGFFV